MKTARILGGVRLNKYFCVIDTETTWDNCIMSIGIVIADSCTFKPIDYRYYIITPEYRFGGMYSSRLLFNNQKASMIDSRDAVLNYAISLLTCYHTNSIFAYNASFDFRQLPELSKFTWYDIMRLAAYKQFNHAIPITADCCKTGKLKRGYGVEDIIRMLSGDNQYLETHNAIFDAFDELRIMSLLGHNIDRYSIARLNNAITK